MTDRIKLKDKEIKIKDFKFIRTIDERVYLEKLCKNLKEAEQLQAQIIQDCEKALQFDETRRTLNDSERELEELRPIVDRLRAKIQNIKEQIKVAEREDYADIDGYCMNLRLEELQSILGEKK